MDSRVKIAKVNIPLAFSLVNMSTILSASLVLASNAGGISDYMGMDECTRWQAAAMMALTGNIVSIGIIASRLCVTFRCEPADVQPTP